MAERKTTPRAGALKIADKAKLPETNVPEEIIAPVGTITPDNAAPIDKAPDQEEIKMTDKPQQESPDQEDAIPPTDAAQVLASEIGIDKPVAVPATPTAAQLAAAATQGKIATLWTEFIVAIPGNAGAFVEPTKDELKVQRMAYIAQFNETHAEDGLPLLDPTDMDDNIVAAMVIKDRIDAARAAHVAAAANSNSVKLEYYRAAQAEIRAFSATIDTLIAAAGGKVGKTVTPSTGSTAGTTRAPSVKWAEIAPKLLDAADRLGLAGFYFVDQTVGGYKGSYHAVQLHRDGRWEKCDYNPETHAITPTGVFVKSWKYFDVTGADLVEGQKYEANEKPSHALSKDEMFGVLLLDKSGKILDLPIAHALYDDKGVRKVGTVKPYAMPTVFWAEAGLTLGK